MTHLKFLFPIAMIAFALVACQDDTAPDEPGNSEGTKTEQEETGYNELYA